MWLPWQRLVKQSKHYNLSGGGGGGRGTQIWFRRGCAAEATKPVPIFKGHFGGKGYPLLGLLFKKIMFLCTLATKWAKIYSIYIKLQNYTPCLGIFGEKVTHFSGTPPFTVLGEYPPPPPPPPSILYIYTSGSSCLTTFIWIASELWK